VISGTNESLRLTVINSLQNGSDPQMYLTGMDPEGVLVFLQPNGTWYRPSDMSTSQSSVTVVPATQISLPLGRPGAVTHYTLPSYVSSGRIWVTDGNLSFSTSRDAGGTLSLVEPALGQAASSNTSWGFVEFTYSKASGLWANVSYVDFVGMILGMFVSSTGAQNNASASTSPCRQQPSLQATPGLPADAVVSLCESLIEQSRLDGYPWNALCIYRPDGRPLRVLSPNSYIQSYPQAFSGYWDSYIDQVWSRYRSEVLTFNTQGDDDWGNVSCQVDGDELRCTSLGVSGNVTYSKPSAEDIFSCDTGPFASTDPLSQVITRYLCAAVNRSTLLLEGGDVQPDGTNSSSYYHGGNITNRYSELLHDREICGTGYAFPYDDVVSAEDVALGQNPSGELTSQTPVALVILVGGL
jgi:hypothetical protein